MKIYKLTMCWSVFYKLFKNLDFNINYSDSKATLKYIQYLLQSNSCTPLSGGRLFQ